MKVRVRPVTQRAEWDAVLSGLPHAHVLQSWDWGDFKGRWGWQPVRWLFEQGDRPVAAAQLLHRRLGRLPLKVTYVPRGPAMNYADLSLVEAVLGALEVDARARHSLWLKIDPDVQLGQGTQGGQPEAGANQVLAALIRRGWRYSPDQIQFKNTVLIDLSLDEDTLLAAMKPKTRYNIRLAERRGVRVRLGGPADLADFYALYQETSQRDGFLIRPFDYYRDVWSQFLAAGRAHLLLAEVDHTLVAGLVLFVFGGTAVYMIGASGAAHRELMPSYLLQWQAIRLARQLGCTRYDMWGAPDRFDESDRMWGVYRFKIGFGGQTVRGLGAYDYAPHAGLYRAYTLAMPKILALMRRLGRRHDAA